MIKVGHSLTDAQISLRYEELGGTLVMPDYYYPSVAEFTGKVGESYVLDAGCGTGDLLVQIQKLNPMSHLMGIELAQSRVDIARSRLGPRADIRCGSITGDLPFGPASADIILITEVLEHLKSPVEVLMRFVPLLKPGGHFIVTFPNASAWLPWSALAEPLVPRFKKLKFLLPYEHPVRTLQPIDTVFSQHEVFQMLSQAGLKIVEKACYEVFPYVNVVAGKYAPNWDIAPARRPLDKLASRLGLTVMGYRVFTRSVVL